MHPYADLHYAKALGHVGRPVAIPEWGTPVLARPIGAVPALDGEEDAMGIYPLTSLAEATDLTGGLERLRRLGFVSIAVVPDPLAGPSKDALSDAFGVVRPFKAHLTIDPAIGPYSPSRHHAERIRRGHRRCRIDSGSLRPVFSEWRRLYRGLAAHRGIVGAADFPDASFEVMADEPALVAFTATVDDRIVGMTLWFAHGGVVYNHLTAVDVVGYANGASFALYDSAIQHFRGQGIVALGGGAGTGSGVGGLFDFKRGFANGEVTALICGSVLNEAKYSALSGGRATEFFPAYRAPAA